MQLLFFSCTRCFFSFRERFPTSRCHTYGVIPVCKKDPSASLGMTIWGKLPSKHVRCTTRRISIPLLVGYAPPSRHFERSREILLALCSSLPLSRKASNFTLSHIRRYTGVQERSRASLGMTLREYHFLTLPIYFPCNNDTREAPSTFAALLFLRAAPPP